MRKKITIILLTVPTIIEIYILMLYASSFVQPVIKTRKHLVQYLETDIISDQGCLFLNTNSLSKTHKKQKVTEDTLSKIALHNLPFCKSVS